MQLRLKDQSVGGAIKKTHTVCYFTVASLMKNKAEQELSSFSTTKQHFPFYQWTVYKDYNIDMFHFQTAL